MAENTGAFHIQYLQIQYCIETSLSKYVSEVEAGVWSFPSYRFEPCEICSRTGCATRHGFYEREVIQVSGRMIVPVVRYLCQKTRRTFSLLPVPIIPYRRYCGVTTFEVVSGSLSCSLKELFDCYDLTLGNLCLSSFYRMKRLLKAAFQLLVMLQIIAEARERIWLKQLAMVVEGNREGICGMMKEVFADHKHFLLGIPSQMR